MAALAGAAVVAAIIAVVATLLVLGGGDDASADRSGATPSAAPDTPSATPEPSPTSDETPQDEPTSETEETADLGIDASDPLSPWQVSAADADGVALWSLPVFRAALTPNPSNATPSSGSGQDLRVFVDPQRVRSIGSPEDLLTRALAETVQPPPVREAYNGLPYGAPYESLLADGISLESASLSDDGSIVEIDLAAGPSGQLIAAGADNEVIAQVTAYAQLAWTAAAVLGDDQVGVVVSLDGEEQPLPATDLGDPVTLQRGLLGPVHLLAPAEGSDQSGAIRAIGLVAESAEEPFVYLAGSGEDIFETSQVEPGTEEPLGTGLRIVRTRLSLDRSLIPAVIDVGLRAGEITDARQVQAVAD